MCAPSDLVWIMLDKHLESGQEVVTDILIYINDQGRDVLTFPGDSVSTSPNLIVTELE